MKLQAYCYTFKLKQSYWMGQGNVKFLAVPIETSDSDYSDHENMASKKTAATDAWKLV